MSLQPQPVLWAAGGGCEKSSHEAVARKRDAVSVSLISLPGLPVLAACWARPSAGRPLPLRSAILGLVWEQAALPPLLDTALFLV